jgi:hypothetical protein
MDITNQHVLYRKRVGTLNDKPVIEICTTGGLYVVALNKGSSVEVLGSGPHPALARFLAEKKEPDLVMMELTKSERVELHRMTPLVPKYLAITAALNDRLSR